MLKFEPTEWTDITERYQINLIGVDRLIAYDVEHKNEFGWINSGPVPTFSAAVAWCEERAKQQQEQGGNDNG